MKGDIPIRSAAFEEPSAKVGRARIHRLSSRLLCFEPVLMAPDAFNSEDYEQTHFAAGSSVYQAR